MTKEISILISTLRLPLMIAVVFIHSSLTEDISMPLVTTTERIFSSLLASPAVPLFMFFAAYLFFINITVFDKVTYLSKLKSRFRTLFIPYVLWNLLVIIFFGIVHYFAPGMINPNFNNVANFSIIQLLDCFWAGVGGYPIAYQFWFIRDLILLIILSPLVYLIVRTKLFKYIIGILTLAFVLIDNHTLDVIFYFVLGATCGIHKLNFIEICRKYLSVTTVIALLSLATLLVLPQTRFLSKMFILSMSACIVSSPFWQKDTIIPQIARRGGKASFFLFGFHGVMALLSCKVLSAILPVGIQSIWIICYFANVLLIVAIGIWSYFLLKRCFPHFTSVLVGNR